MRFTVPFIATILLLITFNFFSDKREKAIVYPDGTTINELGPTFSSTALERQLYIRNKGWLLEEKCFATVRAVHKIYKPIEHVQTVSNRVRYNYFNGPYVECKVAKSKIDIEMSSRVDEIPTSENVNYLLKSGIIEVSTESNHYQTSANSSRFGDKNLSYREWLNQTERGRKKLEPFLRKIELEAREVKNKKREKLLERIHGTKN